MLCPEVWNFRAPETSFRIQKGRFDRAVPAPEVNNLYYNHLVSVVLPDTLKVPESLSESLINDCDYYKVSGLTAADLVDYHFIHNFVTKGNLTGLTVDRRIDCDDCISITPTKKLILSLNKDTYQSLGLEGKVSHFAKTTKSRYIVILDLSDPAFAPGKKNHDRAVSCLSKLRDLTFVLTWEPPELEICPSSIAKYFHDRNFLVAACKPTVVNKTSYAVKVPKLPPDADEEDVFDVVEWLGMISLDGDLEGGTVDGFVNTYETPQPNEEIGQVRRLTWRGLFTAKRVEILLEELRNFLENNDKDWVSLYVQGFSDSPVNWKENEHHFYTNGDNGYTILLQKNGKYVMLTNKSSNKYYK